MSVGFIYVLSNPAMPSLIKIGFTCRNVLERVQELSSSTGVPRAFEIEYYCLTADVETVESIVHSKFDAKRTQGREFFEVSISEAISFIDANVKEVKPERFCRKEPITENQNILGPYDRKCISCGFINREIQPIGLDRLVYCKECKSLISWG